MHDLESIFSEHGVLARAVPNFRMRQSQLEMARAIAGALEQNSVLIAEAGTGTGKTFAYLVPALLSGGKVIISTGTKTLQDQLFDRDIQVVRDALKVPVTVALLKGRANYVCHYYLERAQGEGRFASRDDALYLPLIANFARNSASGDKSDLSAVPENAGIWSYVTSTRENCLGSECAHYSKCFVMEARKQALAADVVVVNHHLFFADVVLRDEGVSELLPASNTIIFDEAHQLPETASLFFGQTVSTSQLIELARDARIEAVAAARDYAPLPDAAQALDKAARDLRLTFKEEMGRFPFQALERNREFAPALKTLGDKLDALASTLESQAERSEGLEKCWQRAGSSPSSCGVGATMMIPNTCAGSSSSTTRCTSMRRRCRSQKFLRSRSTIARGRGFLRRQLFPWAAISAITPVRWASPARTPSRGKARSILRPCAVVRAQRHARAQYAGLHAGSHCGGAAGDRSERRPRIRAVHEPARDARRL